MTPEFIADSLLIISFLVFGWFIGWMFGLLLRSLELWVKF